ncbi:MAG: peptide chain release factor N(5)-glutamine methyltransferase [Ruminococcus sp.]|nr:peptide chain release factor N(5)-glutamine methyltransferase [Ruminococcus sp.]
MVSRGELFSRTQRLLEESSVDSLRFDTQCIFEFAFGIPFPQIIMDRQQLVPDELSKKISALAKKRSEGYPLQYLMKSWEFMGYEFRVGEGVLIPRPDTETLVTQVTDICRENKWDAPKIVDLCSGSGCIAISLKRLIPNADVYAVELSVTAVAYIRENAELNRVPIHIIRGDALREGTARLVGNADIIVCNPPYLTAEDMMRLQREVTYEPETALYGGRDGLDYYRKITPIWRSSLKDGGFLAYEFGYNQHEAVSGILAENGFEGISLRRDTAGITRTAAAQKITNNTED